jgi:fibronectin type 3 domain-containing protein
MRNKKLRLVIGFSFICLALVSVYKIMVMAGFFENKEIISEARQTSSGDNLAAGQVKLAWDTVPSATSYNVYWSVSPGVTKQNGNKISNVKNPVTITGLKLGTTYYFVVTSVNDSVESKESEELSYTVGE